MVARTQQMVTGAAIERGSGQYKLLPPHLVAKRNSKMDVPTLSS